MPRYYKIISFFEKKLKKIGKNEKILLFVYTELMDVQLKNNEHIDILKQNQYKIIQRKDGFCFGIDAVLLSDYAKSGIKRDNKVCDLCTGTGIIPLLLESSTKASLISAVEIQDDSFDMAQRSIQLNELQSKIQIVQGDLKNIQNYFPKHSYDVVTCNPPYMINEHGIQNPGDYKAIARHEILCTLEDVVKAADYLLKPQGGFFMIHRPFRLSEIFVTMTKYGLEPKKMRLIYPHENEEPNMVLVQGVKGGRPRITVEKPLVVRHHNGEYTEEILEIYK